MKAGRKTPLWPAIVAALIAVGAGVYLLLTHTVASNSVFDPLLHAAGAYFIARGIFMGWSAARTVEQIEAAIEALQPGK